MVHSNRLEGGQLDDMLLWINCQPGPSGRPGEYEGPTMLPLCVPMTILSPATRNELVASAFL